MNGPAGSCVCRPAALPSRVDLLPAVCHARRARSSSWPVHGDVSRLVQKRGTACSLEPVEVYGLQYGGRYSFTLDGNRPTESRRG